MIHPLEEPAMDLGERNRYLERRVAELERAASDRRETDALRERFLSTLCHELRTPLAALSACREILATRSARLTPERTVRFQDLLCREAGRLSGLLQALLELDRQGSSLRGGSPGVLVSEVVHEAAALLEPLAANRQVRLKLDTGQADTRLQANRDPLRHLVLHLGSNAIRFTPEGGTVTIRLESDAHGVSLLVEDTGIGIPAESIDRVFERFHRVEDTRAHREGGAGIGLALCRSIAESHGGSISVASGTDRGSRFTVTLPRPQEGVHS